MSQRVQTLVQLSDELLERLDRTASTRGVSRSQLIRALLDAALVDERDEIGRRLVDGYSRVPQSEGRDAWGDLEGWSEVVARRNLAALADEEEEGW